MHSGVVSQKLVPSPEPSGSPRAFALGIGLLALLVWTYWPVILEMAGKWSDDPQYSHAYLVPIFSLFLFWRNSKSLRAADLNVCWWGLVPLTLGIIMRLAGARLYFSWLEAVSLLPTIGGIFMLLGGWRVTRANLLAIGFLVFMIPLPYRLETGLSLPLQRIATNGATFVLQAVGRPAFAEGNVIVINDAKIGVVGACNGLGMFLLFFATAAAVAILIDRPLWERLLIFLSAAPIAVAVNIIRIAASSFVHEAFNSPRIDELFHDFAGWLMMPLALSALWLLVKFLSTLLIPDDTTRHVRPNKVTESKGSRTNRKEAAAPVAR